MTSSRTTTLTKRAALSCCTSAPGTRSGFRCMGMGTKMVSMLTTSTIPLSWASSCTLTQITTKVGGAAWKRMRWLNPRRVLGHWRYSYIYQKSAFCKGNDCQGGTLSPVKSVRSYQYFHGTKSSLLPLLLLSCGNLSPKSNTTPAMS